MRFGVRGREVVFVDDSLRNYALVLEEVLSRK